MVMKVLLDDWTTSPLHPSPPYCTLTFRLVSKLLVRDYLFQFRQHLSTDHDTKGNGLVQWEIVNIFVFTCRIDHNLLQQTILDRAGREPWRCGPEP